MPPFGAHFSVAGGVINAVKTAVRFECPTLQLFTKNASQWKASPITDDVAKEFKAAVKEAKLKQLAAHDSYLINLAAPGDELFEKSIAAFAVELERAEQLGLDFLVTHPGAHVGSGDQAGLNRVVKGLDDAMKRVPGLKVKTLIETTAGQGTSLGWKFEHLQFLLENVAEPERFAICLDTCHVFAAGYPISTKAEYDETFGTFDELIGVKKIALFHVNDSVKGLGSRVDRHAGLGLGLIGESAFQHLVNDKRFLKTPMILETPKEDADGNEMDPVNLAKLRGWVGAK